MMLKRHTREEMQALSNDEREDLIGQYRWIGKVTMLVGVGLFIGAWSAEGRLLQWLVIGAAMLISMGVFTQFVALPKIEASFRNLTRSIE